MASPGMKARLGSIDLRSPLIAASGTVGSVWEWATVADVNVYGAAVAKSVSATPWEGRPAPRVAPAGPGMLNGIGIQNRGIAVWVDEMTERIEDSSVPIWGSAVGETVEEYLEVARDLEEAGVTAIEVNLSCPNLEGGKLFALDASLSGEVIAGVSGAVAVPVGAKLSPNSEDIVSVGGACLEAGAEFLTLTNTAWGFGVDLETGRPKLSGGVGGYSGPGLKAIALRCVYEVATSIPNAPILGCGGVRSGADVVEYMMAGASAVGIGTTHLAEPRAGKRIARELDAVMKRLGFKQIHELVGKAI